MKDIQEIMKEMNAVADEIAQTVDLGLTCTCNAPCSGTGGVGLCEARDVTVTSACVITIPAGFTLSGAPRIAYSLESLRVIVEECICVAANRATRYAVRIIGSIPYVVNLPLSNTGICTAPANTSVSLCCSGVASVDNVLGFSCDRNIALIARGIINGSLLNCNSVAATFGPVNTTVPGFAIVPVTFTFNIPCLTPGAALDEE